jgi:TnpA family transposase
MESFTPTPDELSFVEQCTRVPGSRLALLILLKTFQRLGYFVQLADVPAVIGAHIAGAAEMADGAEEFAVYDGTTYRTRLMKLVREFAGVMAYDRTARSIAVRASMEASRTRDDVVDIVNVAIEELIRHRYELPAFSTLLHVARTARAFVNRSFHRQVAAAISPAVRERFKTLLMVPKGSPRSAWDMVKTPPLRPTLKHMRDFLRHLTWLRSQTVHDVFHGIPDQKLQQFAAEAFSLNAAAMSHVAESRRLTLIAALLGRQLARAIDDAATMFIRIIQRMHSRAKKALEDHRKHNAEEADALIAILRDTALACQYNDNQEARIRAVDNILLSSAGNIVERCETHAAIAGNNYLPFLMRFYREQRAVFLQFLEHAAPASTSQDRSVEEAIRFLLAHRTHCQPKLKIVPTLDLSFVTDAWWPLVTGQAARQPAPVEVDRRYFEMCLFTQVVNELKSGDLYISGSEEYGDYRRQLISWEEHTREVAGYTEQAGIPSDPKALIASLKSKLAATAAAVDKAFPENAYVGIVDGEPVLKKLRAKGNHGAERLAKLMKERMKPVGILQGLAETEHWLGWSKYFGPITGFESKLENARERRLATTFCYGCGLGPSQTARSLKGLDRRQIAFINQRQVTEENLDDAITTVVDAYAGIALNRHWGTGKSASADGTKWDIHPQSLMTEYHVRYGGYGGIGFYLVSDTYIALFSRFSACGAYEGHSILDFVSQNRSLLQPDKVHCDTHGQNAPIFGLAHLLGIDLMPRIRNWKDLHLFRADPGTRYEHIDELFTNTAIDWNLIEAHLPDMLRVVLSIRAGRLLPSAILRRLGTYSRKNRLYFAFRELGRVIRTIFLLRYLDSVDLRRTIHAATNKSEHFNLYSQWVSFGGNGLVTALPRDEQRKMIKYTHLVANLLIFHTTVMMTKSLDAIRADGLGEAITEEALAGLSPYLTEHINRFGDYVLDLTQPPEPLPFVIQPRKRSEAQLRSSPVSEKLAA